MINIPKTDNAIIQKAFLTAYATINSPKYKNIICSISGGSDSDIMLDIIHRVDEENKVRYVWFDTGLEYSATKKHLEYLKQKYNIEIQTIRALKPIPTACKEYGQPFLNKFISEQIERLQKFGFKWEDKPFEELCVEYPECVSAIKWWCSAYETGNGYDRTMFNISYKRYLKEFLIKYPPKFSISSKCCKYAKKDVSHQLMEDTNCDLMLMGIRKSENGIRSATYNDCLSQNKNGVYHFRPIFWFSNEDKAQYELMFDIKHSECYTKYGFKRTGCCCCPFGGNELSFELAQTAKYEPKLYTAVSNVFQLSYDYTKQYKEFVSLMKDERKGRRRLF